MKVGIVGAEAAKFTTDGEAQARELIRLLLDPGDICVSGGCHLGGVDIWAEEEARALGLEVIVYPPATLSWESGYKPRNIQIAEACETLCCIVVDAYPPHYTGMRFNLCYHCKRRDHIKSGGCWTGKYANRLGKPWHTFIVTQ